MKIKKPKTSILFPFYNAELTLERAISSISDQTFTDFECILINNNSSDNSAEIANRFCEADKRFLLVHEEKRGIVYALNHGLKVARGEFIARMDADDWSFPDRLEHQNKFLNEHKEYGVVAGKAEYKSHKPETGGFERYVNWSNSILDFKDIYNKQFMESPLIHPTVMWRKSVSDKYGVYAYGNFPEDYELWLRWLANGVKFHKLRESVIKWFDTDQRLTRTHVRYSDEAFYSIKTHYLVKWLKIHNPWHPKVLVWGASKISRNRALLLENPGIKISGFIDISKKRQLDRSIIYYKDIPTPKETFILIYLKEESMRANTVNFLTERGFKEGKNYLLVS